MASAPRSSGARASHVTSGLRGASPAGEQAQKGSVRVVRGDPSTRVRALSAAFQGYQPSGGNPYVGRLRAGATTSL